jgi:hypothetical protein
MGSRISLEVAVEDAVEVLVRLNEQLPAHEVRPPVALRVEQEGDVEDLRAVLRDRPLARHVDAQDAERPAAHRALRLLAEQALGDLERAAIGEHERAGGERQAQAAADDVEIGLREHPGERLVDPEGLLAVDRVVHHG